MSSMCASMSSRSLVLGSGSVDASMGSGAGERCGRCRRHSTTQRRAMMATRTMRRVVVLMSSILRWGRCCRRCRGSQCRAGRDVGG